MTVFDFYGLVANDPRCRTDSRLVLFTAANWRQNIYKNIEFFAKHCRTSKSQQKKVCHI